MNTSIRYPLLALHIISLCLMFLGWALPIISIDIFTDIPIIGKYYFLQESRSVLGTLEKLFDNGNWLPACLILLFGILIPVIKSLFIFRFILSNDPMEKWKKIVSSISKWAMADVFAMGILIAFLAANSMQQTQANFHAGFYCFTAYCILSAMLAHWVLKKHAISAKN